MEHKPFVITIVGPESSGKTTLARQLALHYGCSWVPEYAREYLEGLGRSYMVEDLAVIAEGQYEAIARAMKGPFAVSSLQPADISWILALGGIPVEVLKNSFLIFPRETFGEEPRPVVIVDSGMLSLRMWARIKYGITIPVVEEILLQDVTSLYILCRPRQEWEMDPLREAPLLLDRAWIYNQYLLELVSNPGK